jgi:hypothetical protein
MFARVERGSRQFVPTFLLAQATHFPDKIIVGFSWEPHFQHVPDAEPLILASEEAPRALQLAPELHEAFLIVFYVHHTKIDFDHFDHDHFDR